MKVIIMEKPYVISEELDLSDAYSNQIINVSKIDEFRASLDADLRSAGKNTSWVSSAQLKSGINQMVVATSLPVVSLDDRYVRTADQYLGISRGVDEQLSDVGYVPRAGYGSLERQLNAIPDLGAEVVIADDVLFSGEMLSWLADELAWRNVKVGAVVCGIAIREGAIKLGTEGIDVQACIEFDDVDDEICERDFAIVPGSGRRIDSMQANALYFDTLYGKPDSWASLPSSVTSEFMDESLARSTNLLNDNVRMESLGSFVGYASSGDAKRIIASRREAL